MIAASSVIHVATDWPALGVFFLGLIGTIGGFAAWVIRRLDKNRAEWKEFISHEVQIATSEVKHEVSQLSTVVDDNSRELRDQGKAIARIEGRLGTTPTGSSQAP